MSQDCSTDANAGILLVDVSVGQQVVVIPNPHVLNHPDQQPILR